MCFFSYIVKPLERLPIPVHSLIQSIIAQHVKYVNRNALSMFKALNKCFTF